ncbi:MAG: T9SS type A sorting domain-containing protein [Bacteroidetes bacterium]|nr:T9SS type A sorting domain-containing protein [Bacteroidota bacterium]
MDIASANLNILDTKGSIVYDDNLFGKYWQIDISLLPKGIYFIKIEMEGTQFDAKMEKL